MRKYAVGLSMAVVLGTGAFQQSSAGDVLIPYIKSGGNWVSLVSYTTLCPNYGGTPQSCNNPTRKLHFIYHYKKDWDEFFKIADSNYSASDGSYDDVSCKEYNVEVPATQIDFTTVDVSVSNKLGLTDNVLGKKEGYDGAVVAGQGPTAPTNNDFVLEPDSVVDAYLVIQDGNTDTDNINSFDDDWYLAVEAVVFDMVTGMFFYQFGLDLEGGALTREKNAPPGSIFYIRRSAFDSANSIVMFQGEDFATTSVYYIPTDTTNATTIVDTIVSGIGTGCITVPGNKVYDRQEDGKSGTEDVCINCLALIPVKYFMTDSTWNKVKNGGGLLGIRDNGGITYKGEVFKIGRNPNIFAPLKTYENSLASD